MRCSSSSPSPCHTNGLRWGNDKRRADDTEKNNPQRVVFPAFSGVLSLVDWPSCRSALRNCRFTSMFEALFVGSLTLAVAVVNLLGVLGSSCCELVLTIYACGWYEEIQSAVKEEFYGKISGCQVLQGQASNKMYASTRDGCFVAWHLRTNWYYRH